MNFFSLLPERNPGMVAPDQALPGRPAPAYVLSGQHAIFGGVTPADFPDDVGRISLGLGCFWGVEKEFWQLEGVLYTAAAYQGGYTPNPTYEEVCTGLTGHAEVVYLAYDRSVISDAELLAHFWENHDPTQGYRQGNDVGSQYRSAIYFTTPEQERAAQETRDRFAAALAEAGYGEITTEIRSAQEAGPVYLAEEYHQQYLLKNPNGYCPIHATGIKCA